MILYHGSKDIIRSPKFGFGKNNNDYGKGFYCTKDIDLACEWAVDTNRSGYANEYEVDLRGLAILDLDSDEYTVLNWLAILLDNRIFEIQSDIGEEVKRYLKNNFLFDYGSYDLICGYRADDSYFSFAQDFLNNAISLSTLKEAMFLGKLGRQYVLKSEKAFERIEYVKFHNASDSIWYPQKERRDKKARDNYFSLRKKPWQKGEVYALSIIEQEITNDDIRIRQ